MRSDCQPSLWPLQSPMHSQALPYCGWPPWHCNTVCMEGPSQTSGRGWGNPKPGSWFCGLLLALEPWQRFFRPRFFHFEKENICIYKEPRIRDPNSKNRPIRAYKSEALALAILSFAEPDREPTASGLKLVNGRHGTQSVQN